MQDLYHQQYLTLAFKELTCFGPNKCDPFWSWPPHSSHTLVAGCNASRINAELCKGWSHAGRFPEKEKLSFQEQVGSSEVASSAQNFRIGHS